MLDFFYFIFIFGNKKFLNKSCWGLLKEKVGREGRRKNAEGDAREFLGTNYYYTNGKQMMNQEPIKG